MKQTDREEQGSEGTLKKDLKRKVKENTCITHGHGSGDRMGGGRQRGKNWDNCNNINNKLLKIFQL